jgi:hypothetical protein
MEKIAKWHHGIPNKEQFDEAIAEINDRINNLNDLHYERKRDKFNSMQENVL